MKARKVKVCEGTPAKTTPGNMAGGTVTGAADMLMSNKEKV